MMLMRSSKLLLSTPVVSQTHTLSLLVPSRIDIIVAPLLPYVTQLWSFYRLDWMRAGEAKMEEIG